MDGIALFDGEGTFLFGNARYRDMFFDAGKTRKAGETAIEVVGRIVAGGRVFGRDQVDPDHAVLAMLTNGFSFVQDAECALRNGQII